MSLAIRLVPEVLRSLAFGSISGVYAGIGSELNFPSRILHIINQTDAVILFSINGIDDHFVLPPDGYVIYDICTNQSVAQALFIAKGTRFYAKQLGAAPTTGSIYLTSWYGLDGLGGY